MTTTLVLTEKPSVARRIAKTLGGGGVREVKVGRVTAYEFEGGEGDRYVVVPASGHVLELDFPDGAEWTYPAIEPPERLVLKPNPSKSAFLRAIERLGRNADRVIVATDLDTEGSAIGMEILRHLGWEGEKEILRAEFSSLTPAEIRRAFSELRPFDYPRANAGWARRVLDLEWGANVTRGLTLAARRGTYVRVLSSGRVQGPALKMIVDREREIREFVPRKYYEVVATLETGSGERFSAVLLPPKGEGRIWDRDLAERVREEVSGAEAEARVSSREVRVPPPPPFDGTTLQVEGSRITGMKPREIADRSRGVAQQLYEAGLISYIGTESQKWPKGWGAAEFRRMVEIIGSWERLSREAGWVLANMRERAVEGKKEDPAHPCIHVVGSPGEEGFRSGRHERIYEIVARRCLAALAPDGLDRKTRVEVSVGGHRFRASGRVIVEEGWRRVYPYARGREVTLPDLRDGEVVRFVDVEVVEKETQPPKRYTPTSMIRAMERLGLGTKNTRAAILDTLRERGYVEGESFRPTPLGEAVVEVLSREVPEIVSPEMTARLDEAMRKIERGELDPGEFLNETLDALAGAMEKFKRREAEISEMLSGAVREYRRSKYVVGRCPKCGRELRLFRSRYGWFVACTGYPECDVKYNLLPGEKIADGTCGCGLPLVSGSVRTRAGKTLRYVRCLGNCERTPLRCAACGAPAVPKKGRYGVYVECTGCGKTNYFRSPRGVRRG